MMFAVAQKRYLYIYDHSGMELHCLKQHSHINALTFLPYHFLLVSAVGHQNNQVLFTAVRLQPFYPQLSHAVLYPTLYRMNMVFCATSTLPLVKQWLSTKHTLALSSA